MPERIRDVLKFLCWLGFLQLARWAVILFCALDVAGILALWGVAFIECQMHDTAIYLLIPMVASQAVMVQVALWQFLWLRLSQRGGKWQALAEWFSAIVRYPVVRGAHPWESGKSDC